MNLTFGRSVVPVTNQEQALKFYTQTLGCVIIYDGPGPNGMRFIHVGFEGQENVGLWLFPFEKSTPSNEPILVLYTPDLNDSYKQIVEKGIPIIRQPSEDGSSRFMHISDPDGNIIIIVQLLLER